MSPAYKEPWESNGDWYLFLFNGRKTSCSSLLLLPCLMWSCSFNLQTEYNGYVTSYILNSVVRMNRTCELHHLKSISELSWLSSNLLLHKKLKLRLYMKTTSSQNQITLLKQGLREAYILELRRFFLWNSNLKSLFYLVGLMYIRSDC